MPEVTAVLGDITEQRMGAIIDAADCDRGREHTGSMRLTPTQSDRAPGVLLGQAGGDVPTVPYEFVRALADQLAEITGGGLGSTEMTSGYPATDFVSLMRRSLHNVPAPGTEL